MERIRYTSFSLPYHIGNGFFGGVQPFIGLSVIAATGDIYASLWYPIVVASTTFIIGLLLLRETKQVKMWDELRPTLSESPRSSGQMRDLRNQYFHVL